MEALLMFFSLTLFVLSIFTAAVILLLGVIVDFFGNDSKSKKLKRLASGVFTLGFIGSLLLVALSVFSVVF